MERPHWDARSGEPPPPIRPRPLAPGQADAEAEEFLRALDAARGDLVAAERDARFAAAAALAADRSGFDLGWWREQMDRAKDWAARRAAGQLGEDFDGEDAVRVQTSGYVATVLLSYVGQTPPAWLTHEIERRIASMAPGAARCERDAPYLTSDAVVDVCRRTLGAVRDVVRSCDPAAVRE